MSEALRVGPLFACWCLWRYVFTLMRMEFVRVSLQKDFTCYLMIVCDFIVVTLVTTTLCFI